MKILVDREKLRTNFKQNEYWDLEGTFSINNENIFSKLISISGKRIAFGNSFNRITGELEKKDTIVLNNKEAELLASKIKGNSWSIVNIETKPKTQNPYPPFITSTLQQEGIRKLRMNSNQI